VSELPIRFREEMPYERVINRMHRLVVDDFSEHGVQMIPIGTIAAANGANADEDIRGKRKPVGPWTSIAGDVHAGRLVLIGIKQWDDIQVPLLSRVDWIGHNNGVPRCQLFGEQRTELDQLSAEATERSPDV
jgi:hypothetical protein